MVKALNCPVKKLRGSNCFFIDIVTVVDYDVFGLLIFYLERGCDYVGIYGDFDLNRISGAYGLTMVYSFVLCAPPNELLTLILLSGIDAVDAMLSLSALFTAGQQP